MKLPPLTTRLPAAPPPSATQVFREWLFSSWHRILDYDVKPSSKLARVQASREMAKAKRLTNDATLARRKLANNQAALARFHAAAERERLNPSPPNSFICPQCCTMGRPVSRTKGSFVVEVALWLLFCLPGLIYSLWRLTSTESVCSQCGTIPIPIQTPRGQELWKQTYGKRSD